MTEAEALQFAREWLAAEQAASDAWEKCGMPSMQPRCELLSHISDNRQGMFRLALKKLDGTYDTFDHSVESHAKKRFDELQVLLAKTPIV